MTHKLGILMCAWKRPKLTRLAIQYLDETAPAGSILSLTISPGDAAERYAPKLKLKRLELIITTANNTPLSNKFNAGTEALKDTDIDAMVIISSDDFFSPSYYYAVNRALDEDHDAMRLRSIHFFDPHSQRLIYGTQLEIGAGYMLRRDALERVQWRPWYPDQDRSMDHQMFSVCNQKTKRVKVLEDNYDAGFAAVDVKNDVSRNTFKRISDGLAFQRDEEAAPFWRTHFPSLADQMLQVPHEQHTDTAA